MIGIAGNAERGAVGKNARGTAYRELPQSQQVGVDLQLGQPVAERRQTGRAAAHQAFDVAFLLLQVLRLQEQALAPYDFVVPCHVRVPPVYRTSHPA